jgi:hypothetical protein
LRPVAPHDTHERGESQWTIKTLPGDESYGDPPPPVRCGSRLLPRPQRERLAPLAWLFANAAAVPLTQWGAIGLASARAPWLSPEPTCALWKRRPLSTSLGSRRRGEDTRVRPSAQLRTSPYDNRCRWVPVGAPTSAPRAPGSARPEQAQQPINPEWRCCTCRFADLGATNVVECSLRVLVGHVEERRELEPVIPAERRQVDNITPRHGCRLQPADYLKSSHGNLPRPSTGNPLRPGWGVDSVLVLGRSSHRTRRVRRRWRSFADGRRRGICVDIGPAPGKP